MFVALLDDAPLFPDRPVESKHYPNITLNMLPGYQYTVQATRSPGLVAAVSFLFKTHQCRPILTIFS